MKDITFAQVEVSSKCNLSCKICFPQRSNQFMPLQHFFTVLDRLPSLESVDLQGIGESFMHPELLHIVRTLKDRNILIRITTNGMVLDPAALRELPLEASINLSVDSYHCGARPFDEYLAHSIALASELQTRHKVSLNTVFTRANVGSCFSILRSAYQAGIPVNMITLLDHDELSLPPAEFRRQAAVYCEENGVPLDSSTVVFSADLSCWFTEGIYVRVGGEYTPCCRFPFDDWGNIFSSPAEGIFSERFLRLKEMLQKGQTPNECVSCEWSPRKKHG